LLALALNYSVAMLNELINKGDDDEKMLSLILGLTFALSLTACNTMEGVGQDMEAAGDTIEGEAAENKNY